MKVIFLDVDGVINSLRTCMAFEGYPWDVDEESLKMFDSVAIALIRRICKKGDVKIVLSSTWRIGDKIYPKMAKALGLPIIDRTSYRLSGDSRRGDEIAQWLQDHPEVKEYVIVDDETFDMNKDQQSHIVKVDGEEGLSFKNYRKIHKKLGISTKEVFKNAEI